MNHRAYSKLSNGIKRALTPLAVHIDVENGKLVSAVKEQKWIEMYRAGICENTMDNDGIETVLNGLHCTNRLVAWLGSCVIDAMLDAHLEDDDIAEARRQITVKYVYPGLDVTPVKEDTFLSRGKLDELFNVTVKQINNSFNVEKENGHRGGAVVGTATSYLALLGPTSAKGNVFAVLFIVCVNNDYRWR